MSIPMRKRPAALVLAVTFFLFSALASAPALAGTQVSPFVNLYYLGGNTGYEIQLKDPGGTHWRSKLEYELNNLCISGGAFVEIDDTIRLRLSGWSTLDRDVGTLTDIDWKNGQEHIWSTSQQSLHGWGLEGEFVYWLWKPGTFMIGPAGGVVYDRFDIAAHDLTQRSVDPSLNIDYPGYVSFYKQENVSLMLGADITWDPLSWLALEWTGSVSPITYVWDRDNHLLRSKMAEGSGAAYQFRTQLNIDVVLWERLNVGVWANYLYMADYSATQSQSFYAGPNTGKSYAGIEDDITRQSYAFGGRVVLSFP